MKKGQKILLGVAFSFALLFTAMPASAVELNQTNNDFSPTAAHPDW
ncbi:hypothetical protein [Alkalicoccus luteus]